MQHTKNVVIWSKEAHYGRNTVQNAVLAILKAKPGMGSLQLRKALLIADALHNPLHRQSITGAHYIKHKFGPVPDDAAFSLLNQMSFPLHMVEIVKEPVGPYTQNSYFSLKEPDYSVFSRSQIDILNYAASAAWKYSASRLSDMTHDDAYNTTPMGGDIPLELVCKMTPSGYDTEPFTEREREAARKFFESDEARIFDFDPTGSKMPVKAALPGKAAAGGRQGRAGRKVSP